MNWVNISKGLAVPPIFAAMLMLFGAGFATNGALILDDEGTQENLKAFEVYFKGGNASSNREGTALTGILTLLVVTVTWL